MPFVKLDCGMLTSSLWIDREARDIFITALLMAEPWEFLEPQAQINVRDLELTGWIVPPGWYGFARAAGIGIVHQAGMERESGLLALERLSSADSESRSHAFEGRRLVRIDGGYVVLNYMNYRERDETGAERMRRYRAKKKDDIDKKQALRVTGVTLRATVTQAEEEAEVEAEADKKEEKRPTRKVKPLDDEWLKEVKSKYPWLDFDKEMSKMQGWLLSPKGNGRKMTRQFVINWLNRCDKPLNGSFSSSTSNRPKI